MCLALDSLSLSRRTVFERGLQLPGAFQERFLGVRRLIPQDKVEMFQGKDICFEFANVFKQVHFITGRSVTF